MSQQQAHKLYIAAFDGFYYNPSEITYMKYIEARNMLDIVKAKNG
jgi:hypothetical protein